MTLHHDHATLSPAPERHVSPVVHILERSERIVLTMIAGVLVILAVLLLVSNIVGMIQSLTHGTMSDNAIQILDGVLLVMMTMEIVYTVTLSLQSHKLIAEPFLVIGIIAAIRRTLVITAESTKLEDNPELFRSTLLELALLSVIVAVMAASIYVMRRSNQYVPDDVEETKLLDD